MKKLYRAKIGQCEVHNMACCALDKVHAYKIIEARLKDYGFAPGEYKIEKVWLDGRCDWELENSIIYN